MFEFSFILVEPRLPENIGAAARAIKTMGFSELRLVNPADHLGERARWLAHGSNDILENARLFADLRQAVSDLDFTIACSAKRRAVKHDRYWIENLPELLRAKTESVHRVGVIFGREASGLNNDELRLCDIIASIALKRPHPSLNLAQAVMILAYVLAPLTYERRAKKSVPRPPGSFPALKTKARQVLTRCGITEDSLLYNRTMERLSILATDDIQILHSILNKVLQQLSEGE